MDSNVNEEESVFSYSVASDKEIGEVIEHMPAVGRTHSGRSMKRFYTVAKNVGGQWIDTCYEYETMSLAVADALEAMSREGWDHFRVYYYDRTADSRISDSKVRRVAGSVMGRIESM